MYFVILKTKHCCEKFRNQRSKTKQHNLSNYTTHCYKFWISIFLVIIPLCFMRFPPSPFFFSFLGIGSFCKVLELCVDQAGLKWTVLLCLLNFGAKGICHHIWLPFWKMINGIVLSYSSHLTVLWLCIFRCLLFYDTINPSSEFCLLILAMQVAVASVFLF